MDFATMMTLEPHGPDTFVGIGPKYPWGGLYGGQIVAQALRAAAATVEPEFRVHSLHAYFIRRGDHEEPIRFEVDRIRNGRSFVTRSVVARQSIGAILNMSASFQIDETAPDMQIAVPPEVARPDALPSQLWMQMYERRFAATDSGRAVAWLRLIEEVGDDPALNACALAYMSDDLPTDAVVALLYPERKAGEWDAEFPFWSASLDHAIWFHRPIRARDWHLQEFTCHGIMSSRGLSLGHVFDAEGVHLATISQEVLLRDLRSPR